MSAQPQPYLTPEEYLAIERKAEFKSEYFQGEMFVMSGASLAHNQIVANLMIGIGSQLQKRSCRIFNADMRVEAKTNDAYYYPDVVALCGEPKLIRSGAVTVEAIRRLIPSVASGDSRQHPTIEG